MTNAVIASTPTFNCDHRTFARSAMILFPLFHELANVRIARRFQPVLVALEDQPAFAQDHEDGPRALPGTRRHKTPLFRIVAEISNQVPILVTVGHHECGGVTDVALLDEQGDDGV